jgi:hypothetical protein
MAELKQRQRRTERAVSRCAQAQNGGVGDALDDTVRLVERTFRNMQAVSHDARAGNDELARLNELMAASVQLPKMR